MHKIADIQSTRKAGQLAKALRMVEENLAHSPEDLESLREFCWVQYGFLKDAIARNDLATFHRHLDAILNSALDTAKEDILGNSIAYQIHYLTKSWDLERMANEAVLLLEKIRNFALCWDEEAIAAVLMLRLALKVQRRYPQLLEFLDWWDLSRMPTKEYREFVPERGRPIMSLAEQAHIAYAKALLNGQRYNHGESQRKIETYLPQLAQLITDHPEYKYPPYQRAKLLIAIGQAEEALADMWQFVKRNQRLYWPWATLGRIYQELGQGEQARICLGKAVTLENDETFLVRVRPQLAELLLEVGNQPAAKREALIALDTLGAQGFKVPPQLSHLQNASWFSATEPTLNNNSLYQDFVRQADALLIADLPQKIGVVTGVDANSGRVFVMVSKDKTGSFKTQKSKQWELGQAVALRMEEQQGREGTYYRVATYASTEEQPPTTLCRQFEGTLNQPEGKDFGFVGRGEKGIFVPAFLMRGLSNGLPVQGRAILSYNNKRECWGWKAVTIDAQHAS